MNILSKFNNKINMSDVFISEPFCIFEIENFFDNKTYDNLEKEFPDVSIFNDKFKIGNKFFLNNENIKFFDYINKKEIYLNLYNEFNNPKIFKKIFKFIKPELEKIEERKKNNKFILTKIKNKFLTKLLKFFLGIFNISLVKVGFEFSIVKNDCYIPLHTDKTSKLISLMIYFPNPDHNKSKDEINWGTRFYKPKNIEEKNLELWKSTFMDDTKAAKYLNSLEKFYQSKFTKNKLVGFLKTKNSFHNIEKILEKNALRRSININYYIQ